MPLPCKAVLKTCSDYVEIRIVRWDGCLIFADGIRAIVKQKTNLIVLSLFYSRITFAACVLISIYFNLNVQWRIPGHF